MKKNEEKQNTNLQLFKKNKILSDNICAYIFFVNV